MSPAQHKQRPKWTPEEDRKLLEMIADGKSWTLISAILRRGMSSIKDRARLLKRLSGGE